MRHLVAAAVSIALVLSLAALSEPATAADPAPPTISVSGTGVGMYPAFDPGITRYALTTTSDTAGAVTVAAAVDPGSTVRIDGRPAPDGTRSLTGLTEGDEISVLITTADVTAAYSLVYLPAGFPTLQAQTPTPGKRPAAGATLLTLGLYVLPSRYYQVAVDSNGVPLMVRDTPGSADFKRLPNGHYSVALAVGSGVGAHYDSDIVELDQAFREVGRTRARDLTETDFHDSLLEPDGTRYYVSYEPNAVTGQYDAVIQGVAPDRTVTFQWDSKAITDETVPPDSDSTADHTDYAHINSIDVMADGNILASFRHFSSVFKIATHDQPGFQQGDVMWKLGGRDSTLALLDENGAPDGGPCGQHTATELPDGHILMFDNGSSSLAPPMLCLAAGDPAGAPVQRPYTRVTEWSVDEAGSTARIVWDYTLPGGLAIFAGSAQRLPDGDTFIGHAAAALATRVIASEVDAAQDVVWQLSTPSSVGAPWFSYRAQKAAVPDAQAPVVTVTGLVDGASYPQGAAVTPVVDCTDRGGSTLRTCDSPATADTSVPGAHTYTVAATDGAANTTTVVRHYTVVSPSPPPSPPPTPAPGRPDIAARARSTPYVGVGRYDWSGKQVLGLRLPRRGSHRVAVLRITNRGQSPARFILGRTPSSRKFRASFTSAAKVRSSPLLAPGRSWVVRVQVTRNRPARPGDTRGFRFRVWSSTHPGLRDAVVVRARATR